METAVHERKARIKEIVCDALEIDPAEVTDTSLFTEDHGADSLGAIEMLASLEREFEVAIDEADVARLTSLRDVYTVVAESAGWSLPPKESHPES